MDVEFTSGCYIQYNSLREVLHITYVATGWKSFRDLDPFSFGPGVVGGLLFPEAGQVQLLSKTGTVAFKACVVSSVPEHTALCG